MKRNSLWLIFAFVLLVFVFGYYRYFSTPSVSPPVSVPVITPTPSVLGLRTKTSACVVRGALPDPDCTPGAVFPSVTTAQICASGYSGQVRDVPDSLKKQVYAEYGIYTHSTGQYEVDHLISLELGGSNDITNLWPEAAQPKPGFHEKDQIENYLHKQVCQGKMPLNKAQIIIAGNWLTVDISN